MVVCKSTYFFVKMNDLHNVAENIFITSVTKFFEKRITGLSPSAGVLSSCGRRNRALIGKIISEVYSFCPLCVIC